MIRINKTIDQNQCDYYNSGLYWSSLTNVINIIFYGNGYHPNR